MCCSTGILRRYPLPIVSSLLSEIFEQSLCALLRSICKIEPVKLLKQERTKTLRRLKSAKNEQRLLRQKVSEATSPHVTLMSCTGPIEKVWMTANSLFFYARKIKQS